MKYIFTIFALVMILPTVLLAQETVASHRAYLVRPGDKIEGKVLGEEEFNFTIVVDETGRFRLPFVNDAEIVAVCRTENQINEDVKQHYSKLLRDPMISVTVIERVKPVLVTISGEVRKPDRVELTRETRLLELISFSGGFTEDAGGTVQVFRNAPPLCSDEETINEWNQLTANGTEVPSRMYSLTSLKDGSYESNPIIYPGDIIIVDKAAPVYLTGEVMQQTGVYIKEGGLSLTQAIAMVGGVRPKAKTKDVKIYRLKNENKKDRETIAVNLDAIKDGTQEDLMLEPLDIIEVDKAKDSIAKTILDIVVGAGRSGVSSLATSGGYRILY